MLCSQNEESGPSCQTADAPTPLVGLDHHHNAAYAGAGAIAIILPVAVCYFSPNPSIQMRSGGAPHESTPIET
jgi:hypothetical protein